MRSETAKGAAVAGAIGDEHERPLRRPASKVAGLEPAVADEIVRARLVDAQENQRVIDALENIKKFLLEVREQL